MNSHLVTVLLVLLIIIELIRVVAESYQFKHNKIVYGQNLEIHIKEINHLKANLRRTLEDNKLLRHLKLCRTGFLISDTGVLSITEEQMDYLRNKGEKIKSEIQEDT